MVPGKDRISLVGPGKDRISLMLPGKERNSPVVCGKNRIPCVVPWKDRISLAHSSPAASDSDDRTQISLGRFPVKYLL